MSELYLQHYGVKGMKWGVRRAARKDAKEFARAKMFYGEGAGNRRKLIKAKVNERSKDPDYKKEFDSALAKQDMSKHSDAAKRERKRKDVKNSVGRTTRGIKNLAMQTGAPVTVASLAIYGVARATGADKKIASFAKTKVSEAVNWVDGQVKLREMMRKAAKR
ncbi:MAG: hypothetical protein [Chaetfec virus UA24_144]|nr:MAG: hypothetical protein [Chaetfec virus UA24_144]